MTNQTILPVDANGNPIAVLAPRSLSAHTLTANGSEALTSSSTQHRMVRLLTTGADVVVGTGVSAAYTLPLAAGVPEYIKMEMGFALYAKGSGSLNITVMG